MTDPQAPQPACLTDDDRLARAPRRRVIDGMLGAMAMMGAPGLTQAQTQSFPSRPITLIISFPAGGVTDIQFRALAQIASKDLGQPIVVSNRPGATGSLGPGQMAMTAAPEGYTLAVVPASQVRMPQLGKVPVSEITAPMLLGLNTQSSIMFSTNQARTAFLLGWSNCTILCTLLGGLLGSVNMCSIYTHADMCQQII